MVTGVKARIFWAWVIASALPVIAVAAGAGIALYLDKKSDTSSGIGVFWLAAIIAGCGAAAQVAFPLIGNGLPKGDGETKR